MFHSKGGTQYIILNDNFNYHHPFVSSFMYRLLIEANNDAYSIHHYRATNLKVLHAEKKTLKYLHLYQLLTLQNSDAVTGKAASASRITKWVQPNLDTPEKCHDARSSK